MAAAVVAQEAIELQQELAVVERPLKPHLL
jgi:hypothetical protein